MQYVGDLPLSMLVLLLNVCCRRFRSCCAPVTQLYIASAVGNSTNGKLIASRVAIMDWIRLVVV